MQSVRTIIIIIIIIIITIITIIITIIIIIMIIIIMIIIIIIIISASYSTTIVAFKSPYIIIEPVMTIAGRSEKFLFCRGWWEACQPPGLRVVNQLIDQ
jgi:hypothetical protein